MNNRSRYLATSLIVFLSIGIFAVAGYLQAAEGQGMAAGNKAMVEGAQKMMGGNKMIMDTAAKKGKKNADLAAAEKMMTDGYNMVTKGESMMTGSTMAEGKTMMKNGARMMLDAQIATADAIEKMGPEMASVCSIGLDTCMTAGKDIKQNRAFWGD